MSPTQFAAMSGAEPSETAETIEFVVGRRQAAAVAFLVITLVGLCATVAYLAGRLSGVEHVQQVTASNKAANRAPSVEAPKPSPLAKATAPESSLGVEIAEPPAGRYLQVAATDRRSVERLLKELQARGFKPIAAPGPTPETARVLLGPMNTTEQEGGARTAAAALGYTPFPKQY